MINKKVKFWLKISAATVIAGGLIALPIYATINFAKAPSYFNSNSIGIYVETGWMDTYEEVIKIYNDLPGDQTPIQMLETTNLFASMELVDTLGYRDQAVADLMYMPLDRIPKLAERDRALVDFGSPENLLDGINPNVWGNDDAKMQAMADKGFAQVLVNGELKSGYFAIAHNVEGIILYTKGKFQDQTAPVYDKQGEHTSGYGQLDVIIDSVPWDGSDSMYSMRFNDLWLSMGILSAFLNTGSGETVGNALVSVDRDNPELDQIYFSSLTSISPNVTEQEFYINLANNVDKPMPELTTASAKMDELIDFVASVWADAALTEQGNWTLTNNGIWMDSFKPAIDAAYIGGSWDAGVIREQLELDNPENEGLVSVSAVPPPTSETGPYKQAPGGWVYGINQRNSGNEKRIDDMKAFINILLSNEDIIVQQYFDNRIVTGDIAKQALTEDPSLFSDYDNQLIGAIFDTLDNNLLDFRPDNGLQEFNQIWGAWDGDSWASARVKEILGTENSENYNLEDKLVDIKAHIKTQFDNVLFRLESQRE